MKYAPAFLSDDPQFLAQSLRVELKKIQDAIDQIQQHEVLHVAPAKPRTGQVVYADGTNWNPGSGEGLYVYLSTASWSKL